jgi:hypothetical protein
VTRYTVAGLSRPPASWIRGRRSEIRRTIGLEAPGDRHGRSAASLTSGQGSIAGSLLGAPDGHRHRRHPPRRRELVQEILTGCIIAAVTVDRARRSGASWRCEVTLSRYVERCAGKWKAVAFDNILQPGARSIRQGAGALNKLGGDGWERVLAETNVHGGGTGKVVLFMKRPLG